MNEKLISKRKELKLTQKKLASMVGITERQYQRYEAGDADPRLSNAKAIARALGCELQDIF